MATVNDRDYVSVGEVWDAGYRQGISDALDQLAKIARDPRRLRGLDAAAEARRLLDGE